MIWFNIKELEKRLKNGEVTDKLAFTYLLVHFILLSIFSHIAADEDPLWWSVWVHLFITLGFTIWGLRRSFEINRQGDNRDYFQRFLSLSFVVGIRCLCLLFFFVLLFTVGITVAQVTDTSFFMTTAESSALELVLFFLFVGVYNYLLLESFKRVSSGEGKGIEMEAFEN